LLETIADPAALQIVRALAESEQSQVALVERLDIGQSVVSRSLRTLRSVGVVEAASPRGALRLRSPDETRAILLAADRLAEALLAEDSLEQRELSNRTRRAVVRRADVDSADAHGTRDGAAS
jgi:DNA-binding transcriptional ArsR family regulator